MSDDEIEPDDPDEVVVTSQGGYHRPHPESTEAHPEPACQARKSIENRSGVKYWPIERADAWRDRCQYVDCFGDPDRPGTSNSDVWPPKASERDRNRGEV